MSDKNDLIKQRRDVGEKMNKMTADIKPEDWNEKRSKEFDDLSAKFDDLSAQIDRHEKAEQAQERLNNYEPIERPNVDEGKSETLSRVDQVLGSAEYEASFMTYLKSKGKVVPTALEDVQNMPGIQNSLSEGTDSEGGFLVPTEWERQFDKLLFENNVMRQVCTVKSYLHDRNIPLVTVVGAADIVDEGAPYPHPLSPVVNVSLTSYKLGNIEKASEELLKDTPSNLIADLGEMYADSFGAGEEGYFTTGTGSGQPQGVVTGADVGDTAASNSAITYDELIDFLGSVSQKYARRGIFMCSRLTAMVLRKLKTTDGMPIWQPAMTAGNPETLLGHRLVINEAMPNIGSLTKPLSFGDMKYHVIADRERLSMQILNELYAANGQVGFKFRKRIDSKLKRSDAVKVLQMAS